MAERLWHGRESNNSTLLKAGRPEGWKAGRVPVRAWPSIFLDEWHDESGDAEDDKAQNERRDREAHDLPHVQFCYRKNWEQSEGLDHVGHGFAGRDRHRDLAQIGG